MDLARKNFSTFVYGNGGGRGPATCVHAIIGSWPAGLMRNLAECAARRGNFEITKSLSSYLSKGRLYSKSSCTTVISIRIGLQ